MDADNELISPNSITLDLEMDVEIICWSKGPTNWYFSAGVLPLNVEIDGHLLYIDNIDLDNQGIYECRGRDEFGHVFHARSTISVDGKN